jgi:hypothetical protein
MATKPLSDLTATWNAGGTTFTAIKMNATDTASAAGSLLMDLQVGGSSKFNITKAGGLSTADGSKTAPAIRGSDADSGFFYRNSGNDIAFSRNGTGVWSIDTGNSVIGSSGSYSWSSGEPGVAGSDLILARAAAASLRLGASDAASPVAQTIGVQGSRAGTDSNVGGANLTIRSGNGTGTGTISTLILQAPVAVASGTGAQTQATGLTIKAGTAVMTSYTVATLPAAATAGAGARAFVTDALAPVFGSAVAGSGAVTVPVYSDGAAWNVG